MLTKSDFVAYIDSPRHLWAIKHNKLTEVELNAFLNHLFEQGYDVEEYGEKYIREILVPEYEDSSINILFQPTANDGEFEARADVLIKNPKTNKWDMYEIKSSTEVKRQHRYDVTFQSLVFGKNYELGEIFILHLNPDYTRTGEIDIAKLFTRTNLTKVVSDLIHEVQILRYEALEVISEDDYSLVQSCIRPKLCPCLGICHQDLPDYSIYDISNLTANEKKIRELEKLGFISIDDVPLNFALSEKQRFQVQIAQNNQTYINSNSIEKSFEKLQYPIYFVDYESFNPAIPMFDSYKPYDQIPFQWSLHIKEDSTSELKHYEFIETQQIDPIVNFLSAMQAVVGTNGSIIVWNKAFEGTQNKRMGEIHSEFKDYCENMNSRLFDLMEIFRDGLYADRKFKGSYSIKIVLPVLVPSLSYKGMNIAEGATAMASWNDMVFGNTDDEQKAQIRADLLKYCELDTLAMVRIFEKLAELL